MYKKLYCLIFTVCFLTLGSVRLYALPSNPEQEYGFQNITISVSDDAVLHVTGAAGQILSVYNITGVKVISFKVDGSDKSFNLNLIKGCYIIKVGNVVRKISIR